MSQSPTLNTYILLPKQQEHTAVCPYALHTCAV